MTELNQNAIRSYRPGGWYAIFGEHASVLLPESEKSRVAGLWELVDAGAGFDELLDALIATGLRTLPGFVLVSTAEDPTRIVLRGAARASVIREGGEVVEVDGGAAATWVERAFSDVTSLQLLLEDSEDGVDYGILGGLVRASRVDQPPYAEPVAEPVEDEAADVAGLAVVPGLADDSAEAEGEALSEEVAAEQQVYEDPVPAAADVDVADEQAADEHAADEEGAAEDIAADDVAVDTDDDVAGEAAADDVPPAEDDIEATVLDIPVVEDEAADAAPAEGPSGIQGDPLTDPIDEGAGQYDAPIWGQSVAPVASSIGGDAATGESPAAEAPAEAPAWGEQPAQAPAWGEQTGEQPAQNAEAPSNPFAPGGEHVEPPIWEPPAQDAPAAPAWGEQQAAPAAPAWGEQQQAAPAWGQAPAPAWGEQQSEAPAWGDSSDAGEAEHDGHTVAGSVDPDQFVRQHPGIPGQPQAPSVTAQPVARLTFSDGEVVDVDRAVLVGRAPEARRFTSTDQPRLVTVTSPNQEISSTHLEVRPGSGADHGSAIVTDMGSTNGTVLTQPGFSPEDLQPGIAVQLLPGAVIDLGDGVTIQVTNV